jgi:hypothetical protein
MEHPHHARLLLRTLPLPVRTLGLQPLTSHRDVTPRARVRARAASWARSSRAPAVSQGQRLALTQPGPSWPPGPTCRCLGAPDPGGHSIYLDFHFCFIML